MKRIGQPTKCPECGGETEWDDNAEETVCTECGFVFEQIEDRRETLNSGGEEWTGLESTEPENDNELGQSEVPETVDEWEMWYPCPVCGSTDLNQIVQSHLSVSANEDGSYGGESSFEEYDYVECDNCGEVLLDTIGKS